MRRKFSTPRLGTSTSCSPHTPSSRRLSTKELHSFTTMLHSASARPVYVARWRKNPVGSTGCTTCLSASDLPRGISSLLLSSVDALFIDSSLFDSTLVTRSIGGRLGAIEELLLSFLSAASFSASTVAALRASFIKPPWDSPENILSGGGLPAAGGGGLSLRPPVDAARALTLA